MAQNALGEHLVTAKAAHEQVVAALASSCGSGTAGLLRDKTGRPTSSSTKEGKNSANWKMLSSG